jgi:hypothetical protein
MYVCEEERRGGRRGDRGEFQEGERMYVDDRITYIHTYIDTHTYTFLYTETFFFVGMYVYI